MTAHNASSSTAEVQHPGSTLPGSDRVVSTPQSVEQAGALQKMQAEVATSQARPPQQSDFIKFAELLPQMTVGSTVNSENFATTFGSQDAAVLNSLGLQSITEGKNGQFQAQFDNGGSIPFGDDTLEFSKNVQFGLKNSSAGIELDGIKGLKGKEGSINPTLSRIEIGPEDEQAKDWKVNVTGKELMVSGTQTIQVSDSPAA